MSWINPRMRRFVAALVTRSTPPQKNNQVVYPMISQGFCTIQSLGKLAWCLNDFFSIIQKRYHTPWYRTPLEHTRSTTMKGIPNDGLVGRDFFGVCSSSVCCFTTLAYCKGGILDPKFSPQPSWGEFFGHGTLAWKNFHTPSSLWSGGWWSFDPEKTWEWRSHGVNWRC